MIFLLPFISLFVSLLCVIVLLVIVRHRKPKHFKLLLLCSPIFVLMIAILLCFATLWITSWGSLGNSKQFLHNFEQIPHPNESELVVSKSRSGLLVGNSNHCDFFAGQIRHSTLTQQEITDFYQGKTIPFVSDGENQMRFQDETAVRVRVLFIEQEDIVVRTSGMLPYSLEKVSDWGIDLADYPEDVLYVVYVFDVGYTPGLWDGHCH